MEAISTVHRAANGVRGLLVPWLAVQFHGNAEAYGFWALNQKVKDKCWIALSQVHRDDHQFSTPLDLRWCPGSARGCGMVSCGELVLPLGEVLVL